MALFHSSDMVSITKTYVLNPFPSYFYTINLDYVNPPEGILHPPVKNCK